MIAFDLECSKGHLFEGWFNNIQSYEEQSVKGLIECPYCGDKDIRKVISPVTMKTSSRVEDMVDKKTIDYQMLAKEIVNYVNKNFDDVGPNFTKEALKMHYGVEEKRNIKGSATRKEESLLKKEGIDFFKIPIPKFEDDKNN